jgi:hypothetical protein
LRREVGPYPRRSLTKHVKDKNWKTILTVGTPLRGEVLTRDIVNGIACEIGRLCGCPNFHMMTRGFSSNKHADHYTLTSTVRCARIT